MTNRTDTDRPTAEAPEHWVRCVGRHGGFDGKTCILPLHTIQADPHDLSVSVMADCGIEGWATTTVITGADGEEIALLRPAAAAALARSLDEAAEAEGAELFADFERRVREVEPELLAHLTATATFDQWLDLTDIARASLQRLWAPGEAVRLITVGTPAEVAQEARRRMAVRRG